MEGLQYTPIHLHPAFKKIKNKRQRIRKIKRLKRMGIHFFFTFPEIKIPDTRVEYYRRYEKPTDPLFRKSCNL